LSSLWDKKERKEDNLIKIDGNNLADK